MIKKTVLITGSKGQLGSEIRVLSKAFSEFDFIFADIDSLDICNLTKLKIFFAKNKVHYIVNCASYTNVDKAEEEPELAEEVNGFAVSNLVKICEMYNIILIHISTDYVFDGKAKTPYSENDKPNPINVYGKTKLKGEQFIVNSNIVYAIIRTATEKDKISVVCDQIGSPTNAKDLAEAILKIIPQINKENKGSYYFSSGKIMSWYDFAKEIVKVNKLHFKVKPITTKDFKTLAKRPEYSVLSKDKINRAFRLLVRE